MIRKGNILLSDPTREINTEECIFFFLSLSFSILYPFLRFIKWLEVKNVLKEGWSWLNDWRGECTFFSYHFNYNVGVFISTVILVWEENLLDRFSWEKFFNCPAITLKKKGLVNHFTFLRLYILSHLSHSWNWVL